MTQKVHENAHDLIIAGGNHFFGLIGLLAVIHLPVIGIAVLRCSRRRFTIARLRYCLGFYDRVLAGASAGFVQGLSTVYTKFCHFITTFNLD